MLTEKLTQARQLRASRNKKILIGLLATVTLCVLLMSALSFFDYSKNTETPIIKDQEIVPSQENSDESRDIFKKTLLQYENDYEPHFSTSGFQRWNTTSFLEMKEMKELALIHFTSGAYQKGIEQLQALQTKAAEILLEYEQTFNDNLRQALSFFQDDDYDRAVFHIKKALLLRPHSPEALTALQKINQLPSLLPLLGEATAAQAENNLQKEYDSLQQIIELAPERKELSQRLTVVATLLTRQQFEEQIADGFTAIEDENVQAAKDHYQKAHKISPERGELPVLLKEIMSLEKSIRIQQALARGEDAVRKDEWHNARVYFTKVIQEAPNNPIAQERLKTANFIISLDKSLRQFIEAPYRLSDSKVQRLAKNSLIKAQDVLQYSFTIKRLVEQLKGLIAEFNTKRPVTITSDTKTTILIRGVGKVGAVTQKELLLFPGNYTFEGKRDGYKSKLLHILIPYDKDSFTLFIICDEPI